MQLVINFFDRIWKLVQSISVFDIFDILIVAFLIALIIRFTRQTNSTTVANGIVLLAFAFWLSSILKLSLTNYILKKVFEIGVLAFIILFQPEIRRALEKVGTKTIYLFGKDQTPLVEHMITQTVFACTDLSRKKTGALIVFERDNRLTEVINSGTPLDAKISSELLRNIFVNKAPLHDGAVIIREGRIASAGSMLPMSSNSNLSTDLGMRHRAALGMSESSDAVIVVVSEETGDISIAVDGMLKRHLSQDTFEAILRAELKIEDNKEISVFGFLGKKNEK